MAQTIIADPSLRTSPFFTIGITHIPTNEKVKFEAWITQFSDTYSPSWNSEPVYGRMDPLSTYQSTGRVIQLGFDIVNDSAKHGLQNLQNIDKFLKFLYPVYNNFGPGAQGAVSQQNVLSAGPLLALKWTNLIGSSTGPNDKLIGYVNGAVAYAPEMGEGGFILGEAPPAPDPDSAGGDDAPEPKKPALANYVPKKVSLSFSFTVLHTHLAGWAAESAGSTTFIFGGDKSIADSFPHITAAPPAPVEPDGAGGGAGDGGAGEEAAAAEAGDSGDDAAKDSGASSDEAETGTGSQAEVPAGAQEEEGAADAAEVSGPTAESCAAANRFVKPKAGGGTYCSSTKD